MTEKKEILNHMVSINAMMCKGCGYCIKFCPKHILEMGKERSEKGHFYPEMTNTDACINCAICALMCPEGAIEVSDDKATA